MKTYRGWTNWETWMFWKYEAEALQYGVQVGFTLEELESLVFTHISFLAEDLNMEEVEDLTRAYVHASYGAVNTKEIAKALYNRLAEAYELT